MNASDLQKLMRRLSVTFITFVSVAVVVMILSQLNFSDSLSAFFMLAYVVMIVSFWTFIISLGKLASRLKRSWITWVALTWLSTPIGPCVAYFKMRDLVNDALKST